MESIDTSNLVDIVVNQRYVDPLTAFVGEGTDVMRIIYLSVNTSIYRNRNIF